MRFGIILVLAAGLGFAAPPPDNLPIVNFHRVDEHVLRGAQPGPEGLIALAKTGVKTIVDLRPGGAGNEKKAAESLGLKYVNIPMNGLHAPSAAEVSGALRFLNDAAAWPVYVHCVHGRDRTGTVIACYRIRHDGWSAERALTEARQYGLSFLERGMQHFILSFPAGAVAAGGTQ